VAKMGLNKFRHREHGTDHAEEHNSGTGYSEDYDASEHQKTPAFNFERHGHKIHMREAEHRKYHASRN
jgi:hypothetical protein